MVRGLSSFPPFNPKLFKQLVRGSPRGSFVRGNALRTAFRASWHRKEVLAIFQLFVRRLLHKKVNMRSGSNHERGVITLP